jgi:hypothetical protein
MNLLREVSSVRQIPGEPQRRWFTSHTMDLFTWADGAGSTVAFQLTYDKGGKERALTWRLAQGFTHDEVDDGENSSSSRYKETPLLRTDGQPDIGRIRHLLATYGTEIPPEILSFLIAKIQNRYGV